MLSTKIKRSEKSFKGAKNLYFLFKNKKLKSFIQIGSSSEYGDVNTPHSERSICKPKGIYGNINIKLQNFLWTNIKKINFLLQY